MMRVNFLSWLSNNRLKVVSGLAIIGDALMGSAGGLHYLNNANGFSAYGLFLLIGGILGLCGHGALILWGKGAAQISSANVIRKSEIAFYFRPFFPWKFPLDFAFSIWIAGSLSYAVAGFISNNYGMIALGLFTAPAAAIGWIWPQDKLIVNLRSVQITSLLYGVASVSGLIAAIIAQDIVLFAATTMYVAGNIIMFTVRKEYQSVYTQSN